MGLYSLNYGTILKVYSLGYIYAYFVLSFE